VLDLLRLACFYLPHGWLPDMVERELMHLVGTAERRAAQALCELDDLSDA
jgi:hypothetical protein